MHQPSSDQAGGSENQRPPGVISLTNIQIMRPGVPIPQKSVATVTPRVIVGNPRPITVPATMSQEMLHNIAGASQGQAQGQGHVLVKSDGRYQLVRVGAGSLMPRPANMPAMAGQQVPIQSEMMVPMSVISAQGVQTIQPQQIGQEFLPQQFMPQSMQMQMPQMQMGPHSSGSMQMGPQPSGSMQMGPQPSGSMQMGPQPSGSMQMGQQPSGSMQMGQQPSGSMQMGPQPSGSMQMGPQPSGSMQMGPQPSGSMQMGPQASGTMHVLQPVRAGFSQGTPHRIIRATESSKDKCRNFLANLLDLSSKEPPSVERNVHQLIQDLIDGAVEAVDFCNRLERLLNANSQPCLVGFLMKSLPMLRQSMVQQELVIPGVRPPPLRVAFPQPPLGAQPPPSPMRYGPMPMPVENIQLMPYMSSENEPTQRKVELKRQAPAMFEDKATDDDINDVAAMGGVNLAEEAEGSLGGAQNIGSNIHSCGDARPVEPGVKARLRKICLARELVDPVELDVVQLMTAALHEHLRRVLTYVTCNAAFRLTMECKEDERYEVSQDVKAQLKFLEDLDRVEKRRREESEREMLLRAAKSRSKTEDPEQAKLKAKAKEMQRAEMEEVRQREANLTALQAIGPRKKARTEPSPAPQAGPSSAPTAPRRSRMLRVTLRDMLFYLESDRMYARSTLLYAAYLR